MSEQKTLNQDAPKSRTFLHKLKLGFGLLGYARKGDVRPPSVSRETPVPGSAEREDNPVLTELLQVNRAIEEQYRTLKHAPLNWYDEAACVESIRQLEMDRLNLLTRMNGQNLQAYAKRPLNVG